MATGVKRPGREAENLLASGSEIKNERNLPLLPVYAVLAWKVKPVRFLKENVDALKPCNSQHPQFPKKDVFRKAMLSVWRNVLPPS
jgi:hypothetical protein